MDRNSWIGNQAIVYGVGKKIGLLAFDSNDSKPHLCPAIQLPSNPFVLGLALYEFGAVLLEGLVYAPTPQGTWPMRVLDDALNRAQRRLRGDFADS